ncbi:hypothetical protein KAI87_07275 [Myxococcota bacterium]|nr:hypothetical protein [Myxococcota bacterium]
MGNEKDDTAMNTNSDFDSNAVSENQKRELEEFMARRGGSGSTNRSRPVTAGRVFASPRKSNGRSPSEFRMRLERLRNARSEEEIKAAGDTFLKHHQLPDELDVLVKLLSHPSEKIIRESLGQISSLIMQKRVNAGLMLRDKLNQLKVTIQEEATHSFVDGVLTQVNKIISDE